MEVEDLYMVSLEWLGFDLPLHSFVSYCRLLKCLFYYSCIVPVFFPLTLHPLESIASSRIRLRLSFSAWGRGKDFNCDENVKDCGALLERSLKAPLPTGCRACLALHILNTLPTKTKTALCHVNVGCSFIRAIL